MMTKVISQVNIFNKFLLGVYGEFAQPIRARGALEENCDGNHPHVCLMPRMVISGY